MKTKPQAVWAAGNWARTTVDNKKSTTIALYCSNQILKAIELYGETDAGHEVLANLLTEWRATKKECFEGPIAAVERTLT